MVSAPRWLAALTTALGLPENKGMISTLAPLHAVLQYNE